MLTILLRTLVCGYSFSIFLKSKIKSFMQCMSLVPFPMLTLGYSMLVPIFLYTAMVYPFLQTAHYWMCMECPTLCSPRSYLFPGFQSSFSPHHSPNFYRNFLSWWCVNPARRRMFYLSHMAARALLLTHSLTCEKKQKTKSPCSHFSFQDCQCSL